MPRPKREYLTLTLRQREILALYLQGIRQRQIGLMLRISHKTVSKCLDRCQEILMVENRWHLRAYGHAHGLAVIEQQEVSA
jgi:DNA-binding CsgD family transcriptional regulator